MKTNDEAIIRKLLKEEESAVSDYIIAMLNISDKKVVEVIEGIKNDELNHIGNLYKALDYLGISERVHIEKGELEADAILDKEISEKVEDGPYGDVNYADPGWQEDGKPRYPLNTKEHVRAAARYFGMPKNKEKYSVDHQEQIENAIKKAEKEFGIGDEVSEKLEKKLTSIDNILNKI